MRFGNRHALGIAVDGRRRREYDVLHGTIQKRVEHVESRDGIVVKIFAGVHHRFANVDVGGKMQHRLDLVFGHHLTDQLLVPDVPFYQRSPLDGPFVAGTEIVERNGLEAGL